MTPSEFLKRFDILTSNLDAGLSGNPKLGISEKYMKKSQVLRLLSTIRTEMLQIDNFKDYDKPRDN